MFVNQNINKISSFGMSAIIGVILLTMVAQKAPTGKIVLTLPAEQARGFLDEVTRHLQVPEFISKQINGNQVTLYTTSGNGCIRVANENITEALVESDYRPATPVEMNLTGDGSACISSSLVDQYLYVNKPLKFTIASQANKVR